MNTHNLLYVSSPDRYFTVDVYQLCNDYDIVNVCYNPSLANPTDVKGFIFARNKEGSIEVSAMPENIVTRCKAEFEELPLGDIEEWINKKEVKAIQLDPTLSVVFQDTHVQFRNQEEGVLKIDNVSYEKLESIIDLIESEAVDSIILNNGAVLIKSDIETMVGNLPEEHEEDI